MTDKRVDEVSSRTGHRHHARPASGGAVAGQVGRERLLSLLDAATQQPLTTVIAPPGCGKTALLSQWVAARPRHRTAWLTITDEDNRLPAFVRRIVGALRLPEQRKRSDGASGSGDGTGHGSAALLEAVESHVPVTLVLDDFHLLTNPQCLDLVASLVDARRRSLHLVVASRIDLPRAYYRAHVAQPFVELRQDDLAFTPDEAEALILQLTDRRLGPEHVEALVERTEGWAVGLKLAALSLPADGEVAGFIDTFARDDRHVVAYLTEEVLRVQPEATRRFLLMTSVLERMHGPLCDFLTARRDSQDMLEQLDHRSMFLTRADGRGRAYRYHHLFRAMLRHRLRDEDPALEHELLRRAATWHLERGEAEAAVRYLAEAGEWQAILDVAARHGSELLARGGAATVATWFRLVPLDVRREQPETLLTEAAALAVSGDVAGAAAALAFLGTVPHRSVELHLVSRLFGAYVALQRGQATEAIDQADAVLEEVRQLRATYVPSVLGLVTGPGDVVVVARIIRGAAYVHQGRWADARVSLGVAIDGAHPIWQVPGLGSLALVAARCGELGQAEQLGLWGLSVSQLLGVEDDPSTIELHLALVEVARDRDDLDRAHRLLEEATRVAAPQRRHVLALQLETERALLALAEGDPTRGLLALATQRVTRHPTMPLAVVARRQATEALLRMAIGDLDGAALALEHAPESAAVTTAAVKLAIHRGDLVGARALVEQFPAEQTARSEIDRRILLAVIEHLDGDPPAAHRHLVEAVAAAELEQNVGVFGWHHAISLVRALYRTAPTPFLRTVIDQASSAGQVTRSRELVEQLTDREYAVLRLLPTRLSNAEIAQELGVSLNTVKTHLKHIYRKLEASHRSGAIAVAEELHLL